MEEFERSPYIAPEPEPDRTPFLVEDGQVPVTGDTARFRAMKMHIALGQGSPGIDYLENGIISGNEKAVRGQVASIIDEEKRAKVQENIKRLAGSPILTPDIARSVTQMLQSPEKTDPEVATEESFADKFTKRTLRLIHERDDRLARQAMDEDTDGALDAIRSTNAILARREVARRVYEDMEAKYKAQTGWQYAKNVAKGFIPGVNAAEKSPDWNPANLMLPGFSMQDEVAKFWSFKKNSEARQWLNSRAQSIAVSNPNTAVEYTKKIMSMTTSESTADNGFGLLDAQGVGGIAQFGVKTVLNPLTKFSQNTGILKKALKDSTKAIDPETGKIDPIHQIAATGDLKSATTATLAQNILRAADPLEQAEDIIKQARLISRPDLMIGVNTPAATAARYKEVYGDIAGQGVDIAKALTKGHWAERVPEEMIPRMANAAEARFKAEETSVANSIIDKKIVISPLNHTRMVEFQIGTTDKQFFSSADDAAKYADRVYRFDYQRVELKNLPDEEALLAARGARIAKAAEGDKIPTPGAPTPRPQPGATNFQTSMGSSYVVHPDGTTTRTKKLRPEHPGDEGLKERSTKTVYLTQDQANRLAPPMGSARIVEHNDGTLSLATRAEGDKGKWGISPTQKNVPYVVHPEKDLIPLELWRKPDSPDKKIISQWIGNTPVYTEHHFGNRIVEVMKSSKDDIDELLEKMNRGALDIVGDQVERDITKAVQLDIKQEGARWYISYTKPLDETLGEIRDDLVTIPTGNKNPISLGNFLLGGLARSAEDQLAYFQRGARHVVTHMPQELMKTFKEIAKNIGTLKGKDFEALARVIDRDMNFTSIINGKPVRGAAHLTQQSLEKAWWDINEKIPTKQQSLAYWSYHQLMAADWVMRNFGVHRDLMRQGVEHYTFNMKVPSMNLAGKAEMVDAPFPAPGRFVTDMPWNHSENFGIMLNHDGNVKHYWKNSMPGPIKNMINDMHSRGELRIVQVANPTDLPFREAGEKGVGNTVNFVVADTYKSKPLPMNLVDWNPGVHVIYPQPFFVKQPIMAIGEKGLLRYHGDKVIFAADTEAEAAHWSQQIATFQKMMFEKKADAELQAFVEKNLPEDLDFWKQKFTPDKNGNTFLSLEHPIGPVYSGKSFFDMHPTLRPKGLTDERTSEFNLFGSINMDFMANRDGPLNTITKTGTAESPVFKVERARTLDPFRSLTRGLTTSVDSLVVNDAKYAAIEQWVAQYKHLFGNPEDAAANPFQAFYGYRPDRSQWVRPEIASAVNTRERIIQFLGTSTDLGKDLNWLQQKMMNAMTNGQARYYSDHELRALKDPIGFTKAWMFNFKFGFFNPAQFIIQSMGFAHVLAVAGPSAAGRGISGYMISRALKMTDHEPTINRLANIAGKFGWEANTFKEAYATMRATGWDIIGKEHSVNAQTFDPNIFRNGFNTALEWGRMPFTEGERLVREAAWYTAFHEWRLANPKKVVDNFVTAQLLTRADDLSSNMTKASHSRLQEGIFAVPTQFYTFSHRMLEQFWGGRLTPTEKIRAGLTHSALFGLPITAAIGIPWPINDSLKQTLMEDGSPLLDNGWYKAATEGFLSWATHMVTGTEYNVEQRYGPGFGDFFKKAIGGEMSAIEVLGGASGTFLKALAKSLYPFYAHVSIGMQGGQEEYPLAKEDVMEVLREVSSVNNAWNAYYALSAGKYLSRNDSFIQQGLTSTDAAMMILGLTRKDITDVRLYIGSMKEQKDAQQAIANLSQKEFRRAFNYMADGDWTKADAHLARAKALMVAVGDFPQDMIATTMNRALEEGTPLAERIKKDFTEKGNRSQLPARLQRLFDGTKK